jgi:outer membrane protein OmpA-like peptidoglycan-associated protein
MRIRLAFLALLVAAGFAPPAGAAPEGRPVWISPLAGWTQLSDNLKYPGRDSLLDAAIFGLRLGKSLAPAVAFELGGYLSPTQEGGGPERDVRVVGGSASLEYTPATWTAGSIYFGAGVGASSRSADGFGSDRYATFEQAAGWHGWFDDHLGYRLEARNVINFKGRPYASANRSDQQYWFGLTWAAGRKARDTDADGVADGKDHCPATPAGALVDASGCPIDGDKDGIFDGLDQCPNTPAGATVDPRGCPKDSDGDGVWDGLDRCADTPKGARVDAGGCPADSDHDGVFDGIDQCANTPAGAAVDPSGCPLDADGDGVNDGLDKCPDTPAGTKVDADGCPEVASERETELLDTGRIRLQDVNFETAKAELLPASLPVLDQVGAVLRKWPQLKVQVGGHTDSRGRAAKNRTLSEARANAVRDYLLQRYPDLLPDQLTARGYGATRPVVPNTSAANRARNRRVEFVVLNRDVLKQEVEKRRQAR